MATDTSGRLSSVSLLWPPDAPQSETESPLLDDATVQDLDLEYTVAAVHRDPQSRAYTKQILFRPCQEADTIRYRQDVFDDLLRCPRLAAKLDELLPKMSSFGGYHAPEADGNLLREVAWRLGELDAYLECVQSLATVYRETGASCQSQGLARLRDMILAVKQSAVFQHLSDELPSLLSKVRNVASVSVGINLDKHLRPVEATLLSVNSDKYQGSAGSLLGRILGREAKRGDWQGIAQLHQVPPQGRVDRRNVYSDFAVVNPMLVPLFRDLSDVLRRVSHPIALALQKYTDVNTSFLSTLARELVFYRDMLHLLRQMQASGLPMCRPEILRPEERVLEARDAYNVNLALRMRERDGALDRGDQNGHDSDRSDSDRTDSDRTDPSEPIVANEIQFGPQGRVFVLTGPNRGGKTTYAQAIGLIQVLAQAGMYVPATVARISPVDAILTHFPVQECPDAEAGRLGEEARRLSSIFSRATRHSVVLLNESLSNTSPAESLYLARDIVKALRLLGARAVYTTHLHELAAEVDVLNGDTQGDSAVISMVSLTDERDDGTRHDAQATVRRTYRIVPGPPQGLSHAREIAARYGISFEQLRTKLGDRGLLSAAGDTSRDSRSTAT